MHKTVLSLLCLALVGVPAGAAESENAPVRDPYAGSVLIKLDTTPLTDGGATRTHVVTTKGVGDLVVDLIADKGCNVVIKPLPVADDTTKKGKASDPLLCANGGCAERGTYAAIAAPKAEITVTKTEAGDMAAFILAVRGTAQ